MSKHQINQIFFLERYKYLNLADIPETFAAYVLFFFIILMTKRFDVHRINFFSVVSNDYYSNILFRVDRRLHLTWGVKVLINNYQQNV